MAKALNVILSKNEERYVATCVDHIGLYDKRAEFHADSLEQLNMVKTLFHLSDEKLALFSGGIDHLIRQRENLEPAELDRALDAVPGTLYLEHAQTLQLAQMAHNILTARVLGIPTTLEDRVNSVSLHPASQISLDTHSPLSIGQLSPPLSVKELKTTSISKGFMLN